MVRGLDDAQDALYSMRTRNWGRCVLHQQPLFGVPALERPALEYGTQAGLGVLGG